MSASWLETARNIIAELDRSLPADLSLKERRKAVREAYPWGERSMWPYKAWCKAQREYLSRFVTPEERLRSLPLTPLERLVAKSKRGDQS